MGASGANQEVSEADRRFLTVAIPTAAFIGGLCCFTPVVVVLLGLGSVSYAASLTDLLYYEYAWAFRLTGLAFLLAATFVYLYASGSVCSLDDAVRQRRRILNLVFLSVTLGAVAYIIWLYVIVEIAGLLLGIW